MRLIVLVAFDLAFYKSNWLLLVQPPTTLVLACLNLALYWSWVRQRRMTLPLLGSFFTGLTMAVVIMLHLVVNLQQPTLVTRLHRWFPGSASFLMPATLLGSPGATLIDFALLDLLGFAAMIAAARFVAGPARWRQKRRTRPDGRSS